MRILGQLIILVTVFVMLQACASSRMAEQLQSGKISFEDGNYKSAFHKLMPLAAEGNCCAQYAVGYMYYYGYGIHQDEESGLFWMNKSAEQHYQPAIKALAIIKQNKVSEEPTQQLTAENDVRQESDAVLKALAENQAAQTDAVMQPSNMLAEKAATNDIKTPMAEAKSADFNEEHKKKYTLQLMGSFNLADVKRAQNSLHLENTSYCAEMDRDGRKWYVLAYGNYSAPYLAKLALDDLPSNLREMKPWVRQLDNVKILA